MKKQDTFEKLMAELEEICPSFNIPFKGNWVDETRLRRFNHVLQKAREIADDPLSFVSVVAVDLPDSVRPHARVIIETPMSFLLTEDLIYEFHDLFLLFGRKSSAGRKCDLALYIFAVLYGMYYRRRITVFLELRFPCIV